MYIGKFSPEIFLKLVKGVKRLSRKSAPPVFSVEFPKNGFCSEYYKELANLGLLRQEGRKCVDSHNYLNGINHHLLTGFNPEGLNEKIFGLKLTPKEMIRQTDLEFKALAPTEETMQVYRCVGEKPEFFSEYPLYKKRLNIKKGEIIDMREYAYATSDLPYAEVYLPNKKGITYSIEVPAGSRVSRIGNSKKTDEVVFPRSSMFQCQDVIDDGSGNLLVKLLYLKPKDIFEVMG